MTYTIKKIAGVQCLFVPLPHAHTIVVESFVRVWAFCEDEVNNWISHCLEYLLMYGGEKWSSKSDFQDFKIDHGIRSNAYTNSSRTKYYYEHIKEKHTLGLELLIDTLLYPKINSEILAWEKKVILQECQRAMSNNDRKVGDRSMQQAFWSAWKMTIGTEDSITQLSVDQLISRKEQRYTKDNMLLIIAGNFEDQEDFEELIAEKLCKLPEKKKADFPVLSFVDKRETYVRVFGLKQSVIKMFMPIPKQIYDPYAADILAYLLWFSSVGKVYKKLREELHLAYAANLRFVEGMNGEGAWLVLQAGVDKAREQEALDVIHELLDQVSLCISESEFQRAQQWNYNVKAFWFDNVHNLVDSLWEEWITSGSITSLETHLQKISDVRFEDVLQFLPLLKKENRIVCIAR